MTLDDDDIEQIARRVAELVAAWSASPRRRYVDAADLAHFLGIDRQWIYAHARELGAIRLGGPGGRLRFDLERVASALGGAEPDRPSVRRGGGQRRHRGSTAAGVEVIQYEH